MTNEEIIWNARVRLMREGIISGTGRTVEVTTADGDKKAIDEPQQIHTYAGWRSLGYQVRRGEQAVAKLRIWKYTTRKPGPDKAPEELMILTPANFFSKDQVEPIEPGK